MATLPQLQDDPESPAEDSAESMHAEPDADEQGGPSDDDQDNEQPDGGNPDHMIGWIDPRLPTKVRVFLRAIRLALITPQGERAIKKAVSGQDHIQGIALLVGSSIENAQNKLGPLNDREHDQVAVFVTGWIVSTLQKMGVPGLDDAGARQDLIGRVLSALDSMTGGQGQQGAQDAQGGAPGPQQLPPGGPGAPAAPEPDDGQGGTLPQLGGP